MSFSGKVKKELSGNADGARHCLIAETAGILCFGAKADGRDSEGPGAVFQTESSPAARKCFTLFKKTFNIVAVIRTGQRVNRSAGKLITVMTEQADTGKMLAACRLERKGSCFVPAARADDSMILRRECCRRAFLRGAFLAAGSMSDPNGKGYQFELVSPTEEAAEDARAVIASFGINARINVRKKSFVVYVKDGTDVVTLLGAMGASGALMDMENIRIVKEMRNNVNRGLNCDMANINKTVAAAARHTDDINYIMQHGEFESLPAQLKETARLRLLNPEATLSDLGEMLEPPVGKSGVNHRLDKISRIAEDLRKKSGEITEGSR
ncbi:MAG: DNA-binding protein WhiA [Lachnospiraceae bacterium]|nr:DNA-binding protein WhiA [Lachnospiraceae bacterium]